MKDWLRPEDIKAVNAKLLRQMLNYLEMPVHPRGYRARLTACLRFWLADVHDDIPLRRPTPTISVHIPSIEEEEPPVATDKV